MLSSIIIGGLLGLIGGLVGAGLARLITTATGGDTVPNWPRVLGVVLAISLTRPISDYVNRPTPDTVMQNLERAEPAYVALKAKEPTAYAEIKTDVAASLENREDPTVLRRKMRPVISRIYAEKLPKATDADLILVLGVLADEAAAIGQTDPTLCVAALSPQGADISSSLPPELKKRDQEMMTRIISDDGTTGGKIVSPTDLQLFTTNAVQSISKDLNVPAPQVVGAFQGRGSDDLRCKSSTGLFYKLLKLPEQAQGPMIRTLLFTR